MCRLAGRVLPLILLLLPGAVWSADPPETGTVKESLDVSKSSWIQSASFLREPDAQPGLLLMQINGEQITYLDVPVSVWEEFKKADSLGRFYGERIKNRFERQTGEPLSKRYDAVIPQKTTGEVQCAFNEDCEPLILQYVDRAQESIFVAAYAFTRSKIAGALVRAKGRGVDVQMKADKKQNEYPLSVQQLAFLEKNGVPVTRIEMPDENSLMHNKFMVIDKRYVLTGSFNYTTAAEISNWENVLWVDSPGIAEDYLRAWQAIRSSSPGK